MLLYIVKYSLNTENYRRPQVRTLVQGLYFQMLDAGVRCPCMLLGIKAPVLGVEIKASTGRGGNLYFVECWILLVLRELQYILYANDFVFFECGGFSTRYVTDIFARAPNITHMKFKSTQRTIT